MHSWLAQPYTIKTTHAIKQNVNVKIVIFTLNIHVDEHPGRFMSMKIDTHLPVYATLYSFPTCLSHFHHITLTQPTAFAHKHNTMCTQQKMKPFPTCEHTQQYLHLGFLEQKTEILPGIRKHRAYSFIIKMTHAYCACKQNGLDHHSCTNTQQNVPDKPSKSQIGNGGVRGALVNKTCAC